ncbi:MAG: GNAT family N-acetyltransferase [Proteobacteria bacterium]|nr:GNAT family N-acetyltransferase [Pseudomonadota bacterium]
MPITIRPATPNDAPFLGWACVMAARSQLERGWFEIVLRRDEAFCIQFATYLTLAKAASWWHWSLFMVAEVDGILASAMCGFGDDSVYRVSQEAMAEASDKMGISKSEQAQFWQRGKFIISPSTSEDGAWTIENVATKPEFRGTGLTYALLQVELGVARSKGFKRAQISFFVGNTAAERNYTKSHFKFAEEKHAPDFEAALGVSGLRRLARNI